MGRPTKRQPWARWPFIFTVCTARCNTKLTLLQQNSATGLPSNLTKSSAAEHVGLVFLFVILSQYDEGWMILSKALQQKDWTIWHRVICLFDALLWKWLNKSTYWPDEHHAKSALRVANAISKLMEIWKYGNFQNFMSWSTSWTTWNVSMPQSAEHPHAESILWVADTISKLMEMCKKDIPLSKNKTWKSPKFQELKHILNDMKHFGAPINYCAQRQESLLIPEAKNQVAELKNNTGALYILHAAQRTFLVFSYLCWGTFMNMGRSQHSSECHSCQLSTLHQFLYQPAMQHLECCSMRQTCSYTFIGKPRPMYSWCICHHH